MLWRGMQSLITSLARSSTKQGKANYQGHARQLHSTAFFCAELQADGRQKAYCSQCSVRKPRSNLPPTLAGPKRKLPSRCWIM